MLQFYRNNKIMIVVMALALMLSIPMLAFADSQPTLVLSLELSEMFTYAQMIVNALIPIVLITAGFGLGFFVLKVIANAFKSLG